MSDTAVLNIGLQMLKVTAIVTAPIIVTSMVVGLLVSIFQSVTQIQEMTLTFVPKIGAVAIVILLAGHWMLAEVVGFTHQLYGLIPQLIASGT